MAYTFIRTRKSGRRYRYVQESYRVGGKVKTRYLSCTPLDPPVRKKKIAWNAVIKGAVSMGVTAALGKLGPPGGRAFPSKHVEQNRANHSLEAALQRLDQHYQVDRSTTERYAETVMRLPDDMRAEYLAAHGKAQNNWAADTVNHAAADRERAAQAPTTVNSYPGQIYDILSRQHREETEAKLGRGDRNFFAIATAEETLPGSTEDNGLPADAPDTGDSSAGEGKDGGEGEG